MNVALQQSNWCFFVLQIPLQAEHSHHTTKAVLPLPLETTEGGSVKLLRIHHFCKGSSHGSSQYLSIFSDTKAAIRCQQLWSTSPAIIQHYIKLEFYMINKHMTCMYHECLPITKSETLPLSSLMLFF